MVDIDKDFLDSIGMNNLSDEDSAIVIAYITSNLQQRVGRRVEADLPIEKTNEMIDTFNNEGDLAIQAWLEVNYPYYNQIVEEELSYLKKELIERHDQLLAIINESHQEDGQAVDQASSQQ